jgi:hypothetical protein
MASDSPRLLPLANHFDKHKMNGMRMAPRNTTNYEQRRSLRAIDLFFRKMIEKRERLG